MLEGEVDVVADGARYTLRPGDFFWTGTGCVHAFYETQGAPGAVARTSGPGPRHATGTRHERDWNYLAERLASDAGVGWRMRCEPRQRQPTTGVVVEDADRCPGLGGRVLASLVEDGPAIGRRRVRIATAEVRHR